MAIEDFPLPLAFCVGFQLDFEVLPNGFEGSFKVTFENHRLAANQILSEGLCIYATIYIYTQKIVFFYSYDIITVAETEMNKFIFL